QHPRRRHGTRPNSGYPTVARRETEGRRISCEGRPADPATATTGRCPTGCDFEGQAEPLNYATIGVLGIHSVLCAHHRRKHQNSCKQALEHIYYLRVFGVSEFLTWVGYRVNRKFDIILAEL